MPGIRNLAEVVKAHLFRFPFENISKLYYKSKYGREGLPGLEQFLEGKKNYNFGGTCYSNNYYFNRLLLFLGYDAGLCGADMKNPDVHMVSIVTTEGREFLIDAGYAAPFDMPLPRDIDTDFEISLGRDRYVLRPQDYKKCSRMELLRSGTLIHGYYVKPATKNIKDFEQVIKESYRNSATFMNAVLLVRFNRNSSVAIHNQSIIKSCGKEYNIKNLGSRKELIRAVNEYFSIPGCIVKEAIEGLGELSDAW